MAFVSVKAAAMGLALCRVVLVPGAFDAQTSARFLRAADYFKEYREFFAAKGCQVMQVSVAGDAQVEVRALQLADQVRRWNAAGGRGGPVPYFIIAHSQGGLDARFAIRNLKLRPRGLITIGTPHGGTPLADFVQSEGWTRKWVGTALGWVGFDLDALRFPAEMTAAFQRDHAHYFAPVQGVAYAAAVGDCRTDCHWAMRALARWQTGAGDGMVPRDNQKFGEMIGEYDLDHLSEVNVDAKKAPERARLLEALIKKIETWNSGTVANAVANPKTVR